MRVIVSGGGTGGHIYPAITIIRALEKIGPCQVLFIGTKRGLEADIVPKEGLDFESIDISGFERKMSWQNIVNLFRSAESVLASRKLIRKFKPDIVIGTGGYVCGPVLLAASLMEIPTMIQEQNVIPGVTNRILSRFVRKLALGYQEALPHFGGSEKCFVSGNPIRPEVMSISREQGLAELELNPEACTVLIAGGSRGARSINQAMLPVHKYFAGRKDIQLLHVTGQNEYNGIVGFLKQSGIDGKNAGNIMIKPYLYNMPDALAAADIAVFRAGAIGLAELTAKGIPAILVPYPYAAENHQEFNARVMERQGAAFVIKDNELNGDLLIQYLEDIIQHPEKRQHMAAASLKMGHPEAADKIAQMAVALIR
jgi:UDP-N-acetylglucosamine--N-acetylmuramyl-(pentapeptide) pyrophosphoryl-undecaprenol N-acetylglucosamine transferase